MIDPASYADWDGLLDRFDRIRSDKPVALAEAPAGQHPPFWLVSGYDDVMRVSKDNASFLNNPRTVVFSLTEGIEFAKAFSGGSEHMVASLVTFDAPIHLKYRRLTQDWFMPKNLRTIEAEIRAIAQATVQRMIDAGPEIDFCKTVSQPYPLHVVMQILGVPEGDEARMLTLTQQMFGGQDEDLNQSGMKDLPPEVITQIVAGAVRDFEAYFAALTAEKRARPTGDVASTIANATVDGEPLNDRDMMGYYIIIAAAGHDTTSASTAGAMLALARDPEQWARVRADAFASARHRRGSDPLDHTGPAFHAHRRARCGTWRADHQSRRLADDQLRRRQPRSGAVRSSAPLRRRAQPQPPSRFRRGRTPVPRPPPRPARDAHPVRNATRPHRNDRAGGRTGARQVDLRRRAQAPAAAFHRHLKSSLATKRRPAHCARMQVGAFAR